MFATRLVTALCQLINQYSQGCTVMNLLSQSKPKDNLVARQRLKTWVYNRLQLDPDVSIPVKSPPAEPEAS
ncbi:MAG: hypothetical protein AB4040_07305 [Synechococcus sp.]